MQNELLVIVGLGYVGLPLAVEFGKITDVIGFDINEKRINELSRNIDKTGEISHEDLLKATRIKFTNDTSQIKDGTIYIITVPTPIDEYKKPDLGSIIKASKTVGELLKRGNIVIYESTVYPGVTEDVCVPILEDKSGLKFNKDFFCGYSPERINPGDKVHSISNIQKVVSGSTPEVTKIIDKLYKSIIKAGTHVASSIKVAEAAKVIENAQRDINIAFVNELALIFEKLGLDTTEVLEAAGTKWNFLPFKPGLVGGHCIGVDPYYLTHKAESLGYHPQVILAGRRINDNMGYYIANTVVKLMTQKQNVIFGSRVLVLGITFKENCPDIRNSKVIDVITELKSFNINIDVLDPHANRDEVKEVYNIDLVDRPVSKYNAIILAVSHNEFRELTFTHLIDDKTVIYDIKSFLDKPSVDKRL